LIEKEKIAIDEITPNGTLEQVTLSVSNAQDAYKIALQEAEDLKKNKVDTWRDNNKEVISDGDKAP
jgi:post-segregation antitoxin (ccd killing protein)